MKCCSQCVAIENTFNDSLAAKELNDYRKNGPSKQTQLLIEAIKTQNISNMSLLDVGGGVGAIQHALIEAGAKKVVAVEASTAYLEAAQREAERQGYRERVRYEHGDFVALAERIEPADIVTLDRVVCCYPDMHALVSLSAQRAKKIYALVFPMDRWWIKLGIRIINFMQRLRRDPFRGFVHPTSQVDAIITESGFQRHLHKKGILWQVLVYTR